MEQEGKVISFIHQKGGVGKSTLNMNLANYLYKMGHEVCVVDCDNRDVTAIKIRDQALKEGNQAPYDILSMPAEHVEKSVGDLVLAYEFVIIDFPGTLGQPGVLSSFGTIDYVFIPTRPTDIDMGSTEEFLERYEEVYTNRIDSGFKTEVYIVFNFIKSLNNPELNIYMQDNKYSYANVMDEVVPDKIESQRDMFSFKPLKTFEDFFDKVYNIINE